MPRQLVQNISSLSFNGTSDNVKATVITAATDFTIATWLNINSTGVQANVMSNGDITANGASIDVSSAGLIRGVVNFFFQVNSAVTVTPGTWYHVVFTRKSGVNQVYVNGAASGASDSHSYNAPTGFLAVGCGLNNAGGGFTGGFPGKIDDVRVYNRALTPGEITSLYQQMEPSTTGLQVRWKFDENGGTTATDFSGNGNIGAITGATYSTSVPAFTTRSTAGTRTTATQRQLVRPFGTQLNFNGSTAFVNTGYIFNRLAGTDYSVSFWAKLPASNGTGERTIMGVYSTGSIPQIEYAIVNGRPFTYLNDGTAAVNLNPATPQIIDGLWHHWAVTYNGTTHVCTIYIDSVSIGTNTTTVGAQNMGTRAFYLGGRNGDGTLNQAVIVTLDEVAFYNNYLLTQADITAIFYSTVYPSATKAFWYKFDEGSGSSTTDSSGNGNTGTITAATYVTDPPLGITTRTAVT